MPTVVVEKKGRDTVRPNMGIIVRLVDRKELRGLLLTLDGPEQRKVVGRQWAIFAKIMAGESMPRNMPIEIVACHEGQVTAELTNRRKIWSHRATGFDPRIFVLK